MTLLIFGGLVVLCSIFFVLGMLVGRMQGGGDRDPEGVETVERSEDEQSGLAEDLTFYESVSEANPPGLASPREPPRDVPAALEDERPDVPATLIFLQVAALSNTDQANRLLDQLLDDGFPAFLVRPEPTDESPLHRVRVGPFATEEAASLARRALEAEGFNPIVPR